MGEELKLTLAVVYDSVLINSGNPGKRPRSKLFSRKLSLYSSTVYLDFFCDSEYMYKMYAHTRQWQRMTVNFSCRGNPLFSWSLLCAHALPCGADGCIT